MRQFTDAEIQELQAKINDEQERRNQVIKELSQRNHGAPQKKVSPAWNFGLLGAILCLLAVNVIHLLFRRHLGFDQFGNLVVALMLLFNHIAYSFTIKGLPSRIMKTVAVIWMIVGSVYVFWLLLAF